MSPKRLPCSVLDRLKQNKIKHWEWYMPPCIPASPSRSSEHSAQQAALHCFLEMGLQQHILSSSQLLDEFLGTESCLFYLISVDIKHFRYKLLCAFVILCFSQLTCCQKHGDFMVVRVPQRQNTAVSRVRWTSSVPSDCHEHSFPRAVTWLLT